MHTRYADESPWQKYLDSKYSGGTKMVRNPNRESPTKLVQFNTAMKDDDFQDHIQIEFENWKKKQKPSNDYYSAKPDKSKLDTRAYDTSDHEDSLKSIHQFTNGGRKSVSIDTVEKHLGADGKDILRDMADHGYIDIDEDKVSLTDDGDQFLRSKNKKSNMLHVASDSDIKSLTKTIDGFIQEIEDSIQILTHRDDDPSDADQNSDVDYVVKSLPNIIRQLSSLTKRLR